MSDIDSHNLIDTFLERLMSEGENLEVEFKSAQGGLPTSLWPTVSAFANTRGGWIVLGISDKVLIEGLSNASALLDNFYALMNNPTKISQSVCNEKEASVERLGDKDIIVIRIREVPRQQKPIYINNNPITGTFLRRNTGDYGCKKPELERMIREASSVGGDATILPTFSLSDIDPGTLARYRRRFQTLHFEEPSNTYEDLEFLQSINGYKRDRATGKSGLTVAGLLMFGTNAAIREWRGRHMIDYRLILDESDPDNRWDDRIVWEGNLFGAFEAIYPRLVDGLASAFRLQGVVRVDEGSVQVVLRESFVNLLVHADYSTSESSLVFRTPSGFSLRNPGSSRVPESDLFHGHHSDPRNPDIVRMFRLTGLAEEAGTGIPKIIRAWHELGLEMPMIDAGTERYEFSLQLRQVHLLPDRDRRWLQGLGSSWNEVEQVALIHVKNYGDIDNATLSKLTRRHSADVSRVLVNLRERHLLEKVGTGRPIKYEAGARLTISATKPVVARKPKLPSVTIAPDLWQQLLEMGKPMRDQALVAPTVMRDVIVRLCLQAPLSANELATLVGRKRDYLQRRIISDLVKSRRLRFLYPQQFSSKYQRYVAITDFDQKP